MGEHYDDEVAEDTVPSHPKPSRRVLTLALLPIFAILIFGNIAMIFKFYLIDKHPLGLMIANPSTTFMLLVQDRLDSLSYYSSVIIRRLIADPSYYLLGYWYGHAAIGYIKRYSKDIGQMAEKLEEWFPKVGPLLVLLYPHTIVMVMAGASKMRFRSFLALDAAGVLISAVLVREFGWLAEKQVNWLNDFNHKWWIPLTIVFGLLIAYQLWSGHRGGKGTGIQTPESIRRELEGDSKDGV